MSPRIIRSLLLGLGLVAASACVPIRQHQGYLIDADLVNSVQVGVDNRTSAVVEARRRRIIG